MSSTRSDVPDSSGNGAGPAEAAASATDSHHADPLLVVDDLKTHFPGSTSLLGRTTSTVKAVDGISFDVAPGEVFGLVGESGSGKTTLGRSILKLIEPSAGKVLYQGRDLVPLGERDMRPLRRELSLIQQDPNAALNPAMTISQGVGHPLWIHGLVSSQAEARREVAEMLDRVGLHPPESFLDKYPNEISGGQKQRLVIARSLITKPRFVVADEPVAALDMSVRARVLELMLHLREELDLTYLFITHDLATARFLCDRIGILYLGNFVEWGTSEQLFSNPQHPYTRSLLGAIPQPEAGRRGRQKVLPRGEIPDASRPPAGCRFHPRCPDAFESCGWEGRDLIEAIEDHWTQVDREVVDRENEILGKLADADVQRQSVRFRTAQPDQLVTWLREVGPQLPSPVFTGITEVSAESGGVLVRFGAAPEPGPQLVQGRHVACHLHGITIRPDGDHVGTPTP